MTESPTETAEELANFFQSVHSFEEFGPLHEFCYNNSDINNIMCDLSISAEDVRVLLSKLDVSKSMGPDEIHPKILNFLSGNEWFIFAITKLFNKCIKDENIPSIWKTAIVVPIHKKRSHEFAQ